MCKRLCFYPSNLLSTLHSIIFQTNSLKLENASKSFDCINELIVNQGLQLGLNDFDNHLDDISSDWTNKKVNEKIAEMSRS